MRNWKNIYGPVPESFEARVQDTLARLEDTRAAAPARRAVRNTRRAALLAASFAALLTVSAFAAGAHFGFFDSVFGNQSIAAPAADTPTPAPPAPETLPDGTVTREAYEYTWDDGGKTVSSVMPAYERTALDRELADRLIGPYIQTLDEAVTLENIDPEDPSGVGRTTSSADLGTPTVTLLSYVEDEAGIAWLSYSVENDLGLDLKTRERQGYTLVYDGFINGCAFRGGAVMCSAGASAPILDTENSTPGKAYVTVPFAYTEDGVQVEIGGFYREVGGQAETIEVRAGRKVPAVTLEGERCAVAVSPMGARVSVDSDGAVTPDIDALVITMTDGSQYVVRRSDPDPVDNTAYICGYDGGSWGFCFNRVIDPAQIASVTVTADLGEDTFTETIAAE